MRLALETLRGRPCRPTALTYQRLGLIKYGLAAGTALLWAVAACAWHVPWLVPLAAVAFYAVEAQMVFLFPLALDGSARPFGAARRWARHAGGTRARMPGGGAPAFPTPPRRPAARRFPPFVCPRGPSVVLC